jgi:hypothetical protein
MRTHYERQRRRAPRREHFEPSAARDRLQDDRDAYGEFPGQIGDDYDDAERRFGNHRRAGVSHHRVPQRDRWEQPDYRPARRKRAPTPRGKTPRTAFVVRVRAATPAPTSAFARKSASS